MPTGWGAKGIRDIAKIGALGPRWRKGLAERALESGSLTVDTPTDA